MSLTSRIATALGDTAADLRDVVVQAIPQAHENAVAAQAVSGTRKRDPYGHTMKIRQHECLVEAGRLVPGVEVIRPSGIPYQLLRVPATNAVLFPWRYATSAQTTRLEAKMNLSDFRRNLLTSGAPSMQLSLLDLAELSDDELVAHEAEAAEQDAVTEELHSFTTVVTIGYASSPTGLIELGWGIVELLDDKGAVRWREWESLPWRPAIGTSSDTTVSGELARGLRLVPQSTGSGGLPIIERFDQAAPLDDDFGLTPRNPLTGPPSPEPAPQSEDTGTELDQP